MKLKRLKTAIIALLLVLIVFVVTYNLISGRVNNHVVISFTIATDGKALAFNIVPRKRRSGLYYTGVRASQEEAYVLIFREDVPEIISIPEPEGLLAMTWRPIIEPSELFMAMHPYNKPQRLLSVVPDDVSKMVTRTFPDNLMISSMFWNPTGQILAFKILKKGEQKVEGNYLGVSYDEGTNITVTDIAVSNTRLVWTNDKTLYVQDGNDILELNITDNNLKVSKTFVSDGDIFLVGSLGQRVVYFIDDKIYCGYQLLYQSDQEIENVVADRSYLALKTSSHVLVLDEEGQLINKKDIKRDCRLIGISPTDRFVYLLEERKIIKRYAFEGSNEISIVYEVTK